MQSWEDNGFVLYYKALAKEKFRWPQEEQSLPRITGEQMNGLLDGYDLSVMKTHKKLHYEALCWTKPLRGEKASSLNDY